MSDTSPGFFRQLPSALQGLAPIIGTMVVVRLWIEPWMTRTVLFGGKMPDVLSGGSRLSRLMIKTGIIMLGSLYTVQAIVKLDRSMTGVTANALGFNDLHLNH